METEWLIEELETIKNLCDVSLFLIERKKFDLLATILELLYLESQAVVEEHCIEE